MRVEVSSDFVSGVASGWTKGTLRTAPRVTVWTFGDAAKRDAGAMAANRRRVWEVRRFKGELGDPVILGYEPRFRGVEKLRVLPCYRRLPKFLQGCVALSWSGRKKDNVQNKIQMSGKELPGGI